MASMTNELGSLQKLRRALISGTTEPHQLVKTPPGNQNAGERYLSIIKPGRCVKPTRADGIRRRKCAVRPANFAERLLHLGIPHHCGHARGRSAPAQEDSAVAKRLRAQGAVITGKTNLHPLAYGITGENPDFGDCLQPADKTRLTGGSTSGGAASVQEGSAVAAIGTDTGGSIRVPAALCGLAGYRASIGLAWDQKLWSHGLHLAQSFDTLGWIFEDLRDAPLLAEGLFGLKVPAEANLQVRVGAIGSEFLHDCDANVLSAFAACNQLLVRSGGSAFL
jgi:aspartyl-tRNA(Asn)/glutamyl-tRNA(Gln) amidotransferase subunit A